MCSWRGVTVQPMACSSRNPAPMTIRPITVARTIPPMTTNPVSRMTERSLCHQRIRARFPISTLWGGWNHRPERAAAPHCRSTAYSYFCCVFMMACPMTQRLSWQAGCYQPCGGSGTSCRTLGHLDVYHEHGNEDEAREQVGYEHCEHSRRQTTAGY